MTGEEAKKEIIDMANALQLIPNTPKGKAVSMALKALEQESVLDKIRAEIADIYCGQYCESPLTADAVREMALEIIDKYKADMRGEEV